MGLKKCELSVSYCLSLTSGVTTGVLNTQFPNLTPKFDRKIGLVRLTWHLSSRGT